MARTGGVPSYLPSLSPPSRARGHPQRHSADARRKTFSVACSVDINNSKCGSSGRLAPERGLQERRRRLTSESEGDARRPPREPLRREESVPCGSESGGPARPLSSSQRGTPASRRPRPESPPPLPARCHSSRTLEGTQAAPGLSSLVLLKPREPCKGIRHRHSSDRECDWHGGSGVRLLPSSRDRNATSVLILCWPRFPPETLTQCTSENRSVSKTYVQIKSP